MTLTNEELIPYGYVTIIFCGINLIFLPITLHTLKMKKVWHTYFRISIGLVTICSILVAICASIISFIYIFFNLNITIKNETKNGRELYNILRDWQPSVNDAYRYSMWVLCFERLLATIKFKTYEQYNSKFFLPLSIAFIIITTLGTRYIEEIFHLQSIANYIYTVIDIPLLIVIILLFSLNCKKRKKALLDGTTLASKYQLIENYCLILFSIPIVTFNVLQLFIINIIAIKTNDFGINHNQLFLIVYTFRTIIYLIIQFYIFINSFIFKLLKPSTQRILPMTTTTKNTKSTSVSATKTFSEKNKASMEKDIYFKMLDKDLNNSKK